jgi:hypothetical protein
LPSPEKIANSTEHELKAKARLGYRVANLVAIATSLKQGFPTMDELWTMATEEAKKKLLTLRGNGDYSAELVMSRMVFPLDVGAPRFSTSFSLAKSLEIRENQYRPSRKSQKSDGENGGGYAFVYVLNDLPKLFERVSVDLTQF